MNSNCEARADEAMTHSQRLGRTAASFALCLSLAFIASPVNAQDDELDFDALFGEEADEPAQSNEPSDEPSDEPEGESKQQAQSTESSSSSENSVEEDPQQKEPSKPAVVTLEDNPPPDGGPKRAPQTRGRVLEEIIVTAQKREQSLTDVPMSVSALTGEKMRDAGIENLSDLSEYAPNFKLIEGGLVPLIYMRGVGSGSNQGFEMSVGLFNDGIHLGRPHQTLAAFLDVERIEVLKGPQSILFGKNAIAGAMNITSGQPTDKFEGMVSGSWFEPFQDRELSGYVSGPVANDLRGRFALRARDEGGYVKNISQERTDPKLEEFAGRGTLSWDASDALSFDLKLEHSRRDSSGRSYQVVDRGILNESEGTPVGLNDTRDTNTDEYMHLASNNVTLQTKWGLGDHDLEFVSGYNAYEQADLFDADSSRIDTIFLLGEEDFSQFSQEVRLVSPVGDGFDYIVGAFYQGSDQTFTEFGELNVRSGTAFFAFLPQDLIDTFTNAGPANTTVVVQADLDRRFVVSSKAVSAFAQGTWVFDQDWRLTAGARFVNERKKGSRDFRSYRRGTKEPVDPVTAQALDALLIKDHYLEGERESNVILPSVNLQYDLNELLTLYGYWSRGAKSGGYDARNNNDNDGPAGGGENFEYEDEIADAAEIGSKFRSADGTAELNASIYRVEYENMQVSVFDGVAGFTVTNAGSALVQGMELDGRWLLTDQFMLSGSLAYLDFEWQKYDDGPCHFGEEANENGTCDFAGRENQQTPNWSATISGNYTDYFSNGMQWSINLDANYRGEHFTSGDLDPRGKQEAYTKFNTRLALDAADRSWGVALVGKNLTDELTRGISAPVPLDTGGFMVTTDRRRTYGLELRYNFGN